MKEFTFEQIMEIIMLINEINQRNEDKESVDTANNVYRTLKDLGVTNDEERNLMVNYICHELTHEDE